MARSMVDIEDELTRLWGLVGELSEQLNQNRALVTQLKARSDNVKGQAAHVGTGFPLRRFNLDITNEEFHSELEAFSSHLVLENQQLQHENKQLNALLKEYEQTMETVMGKFRGVAHTSQQHDLSLHSYYTSLLQTLQTAHSSAQLHDSTSLSLLLTRISTLLRSALRSMGGEDGGSDDLAGLLALTEGTNSSGSGSGSGGSPPTSPGAKSVGSSRSKHSKTYNGPGPKAPNRPTHFPGFIPGSSGGYAGTEGQSDWALEREFEIMRLEEENKSLRELLSIAQETNIPLPEEEVKSPSADGERPDGAGTRSRKSSLTVEELEKGAVVEADQRREAEELGLLHPPDQETNHENGVEDEINDRERAQEEKPQRPLLNESVLGFQAGLPPPEEAVVDDTDGELGRES